jgi:UDP-2-acetamido-2-deoxy-ribo-hexuluronate aminotransferase
VIPFFDSAADVARHADAVEARLRRLYEHGRFILGPEVAELESALSSIACVSHAITVKSGTLALELCLRALGIRAGDEVVTSPFSWISAAEAVALVGATPVFVDIDPTTYLLDAALLEQAITPRTRAIIPVSLFGQLPALELIDAIAERHGLTVIEDAAQSFGARRHGRRSCSLTKLAVTSFFPTKPLGCYGDGGAVFTNDDVLARRLRALRGHGAEQRGEHQLVGVNGRFDTLQAAVLLAKLPGFERDLEQRRRLASRYDELLPLAVQRPRTLPGNEHVFAQYTLRLPRRDAVQASLRERGVETAVYYARPLHTQPVFASAAVPTLPHAEGAAREVLSLPLYPTLSHAAQDRVVEAVAAASMAQG